MDLKSALKRSFLVISLTVGALVVTPAIAQIPPAIAAHGQPVVATFHAEGAQIYECKVDPANKLVWQVREPAAALIFNGKTVGVLYAGPNWQHVDGSGVKAKMVAAAPGATFSDVPWLKFEVTEHRGNGILSNVKIIQRVNTKGGATQGACETAGAYRSLPYSADYVFLH
jgi:hypothetical protein